jgi:hypothetical protein
VNIKKADEADQYNLTFLFINLIFSFRLRNGRWNRPPDPKLQAQATCLADARWNHPDRLSQGYGGLRAPTKALAANQSPEAAQLQDGPCQPKALFCRQLTLRRKGCRQERA